MVSRVTRHALGSALTAMARGSITTSSSLIPSLDGSFQDLFGNLQSFFRIMGDPIVVHDQSDHGSTVFFGQGQDGFQGFFLSVHRIDQAFSHQ